jgi:hypothetical protein
MGQGDQLDGNNSLTWQQYTGLTYTQAFPTDPTLLNGYFLNYAVSGGNVIPSNTSWEPCWIVPGTSAMGGFFFKGAPDSALTYLVDGPRRRLQPDAPK